MILIRFINISNIFKPNALSLRIHLPLIKIMADELKALFRKLDDAEERAKLLNNEVNTILKQIESTRNLLLLGGIANNTKRCLTDGPTPAHDKRFKASSESFNEENGFVVVYTDGACENNGQRNAKAGIGVWFGHNHPLNVSRPVCGKATNNTAEIQACSEALKLLHSQGVRKVNIYTDSQFTISCMTNWIKRWRTNNWKTASGSDVKNKEELKKLEEEIEKFEQVMWTHVAGHRGIEGNEEADKLAKAGALNYKQ